MEHLPWFLIGCLIGGPLGIMIAKWWFGDLDRRHRELED